MGVERCGCPRCAGQAGFVVVDIAVDTEMCSVQKLMVPYDYSGTYIMVAVDRMEHTLIFLNGELISHDRREIPL